MKYFDIREVISKYPKCLYYLNYGVRSGGKTYSAMDYCLEMFTKKGWEFAYIRRLSEQIKSKYMSELTAGLIRDKRVEHWTGGEWTGITFRFGKFHLSRINDKGDIELDSRVFGRAFSLNTQENFKSLEFPNIWTIVFDEFISRGVYITNEFVEFQNALSTIIRHRYGVKIILLGNSINRYSLYFQEMGLKNVRKQEPGTTDIYQYVYGNKIMELACTYTDPPAKNEGGAATDIYFAFDNPKLKMITSGEWEIGCYPHLTNEFLPKDKVADFFIEFHEDMLHGEIIVNNNGAFTFLHAKTTPIKNETEDIVYTTYAIDRWNRKMCLTKQGDKLSTFIMNCVKENRVFYSTNEVGEVFRNYLIWSDRYSIKE